MTTNIAPAAPPPAPGIATSPFLGRATDATELNAVVNHPSVWPWVAREGQPRELDFSPLVADTRNVVLMAQGGGFVFEWCEPGVYEVHTQFIEDAREHVVERTREALTWMFLCSDAMELQTKVPSGNVGARGLVRAIHGQRVFSRAGAWRAASGEVWDVDYYKLHYDGWFAHASELAAVGEWFHARLETEKLRVGFVVHEAHALDLAHDRAVGAACEMIRAGQLAKGLILYNRWARLAEYAPIRLVNTNPVLLDILDCFLWVRPDGDFEVMPCH